MNAFDNHLKNKPMPDITTYTTEQLLSQIGTSGVLNANQQAALNEMVNNRIIHNGDADDIVVGESKVTRGGVRPKHAPIV